VPVGTQKIMHVDKPPAGNDPLPADVSVPLAQECEQRNLEVACGTEIRMAALAGKRPVPLAVPVQARLAKPGTCRYDACIALAVRVAFIEHVEVIRAQGLRLLSLHPVKQTLEQYFVSQVNEGGDAA